MYTRKYKHILFHKHAPPTLSLSFSLSLSLGNAEEEEEEERHRKTDKISIKKKVRNEKESYGEYIHVYVRDLLG